MVCPAQVIPVWCLTWIKNSGHFQHFSYSFWALDCKSSKLNIHSSLSSLMKRLWWIDKREITHAARYKSDHFFLKKASASECLWTPPGTWKAGYRKSWEGAVGGEVSLRLWLGKKRGGNGKREICDLLLSEGMFSSHFTPWPSFHLFMVLGQAK